jgi:hypothetical protein
LSFMAENALYMIAMLLQENGTKITWEFNKSHLNLPKQDQMLLIKQFQHITAMGPQRTLLVQFSH